MWRVLHECGVDEYLIRSMSSLYNGCRACVWLGSRVDGIFRGKKGVETETGSVYCPRGSSIFSLRGQ